MTPSTSDARMQQSTRKVAQPVIKYHYLQKVAEAYQLNSRQKEALFGVPIRTQTRYQKQDTVLSPLVIDRLERFQRITQQAIDLFEDEGVAKQWLSTPKDSLQGQTPLEVMTTDAGVKRVEQILYRAEYGVYG